MIKLWICLALIASISSNVYADSREQEELYDDYYLNDMDQGILKPVNDIFKTTVPDLFGNLYNSKEVNDESSEVMNYEDEKKFEEELDQYIKNKADSNLDDYQFEDNRSEDEVDSSNEIKGSDLIRPLSGLISQEDAIQEDVNELTELPTGLPKVYEDADKTILAETKSILDEDTINEFKNDNTSDEKQAFDDNSRIFEETSKILEEAYSNKNIDKDFNNGGEEMNSVSESVEDFDKISITSPDVEDDIKKDDTVDKAYTDLISDFDKLHGVWKKFNEFDGNSNGFGSDEKNQEADSSNDYEEIDDKELDKIFQSYVDEENGEDELVLSDEKFSDDVSQAPATKHKFLPYISDELVASVLKENVPTSTVSNIVPTVKEASKKEAPTLSQEQMAIVEENSLINEFVKEHQSAYNIKASDVRNAINMRLTRDTPVEVTSPNYPFPYPTNNTVDWMFTGDGMGIELNITDFSVNGHLGDYLLLKPGGVNESGSSGILFTYHLRTERRYRFLDVDKMFVRFFAKPGNQFMRGFNFTARMVAPRPGGLVEPEPEPEIGMPDPPATITVNLGGISLQNFLQIEEEFRLIIADMATLYINTHGINPGINTTIESTQITSRSLCFHNWPKFELCTEVRFGVPIVYDGEKNDTIDNRLHEEDLMNMWTFYSQRDPFAVRLRILGITEYQVPNDAGVLTLWLVVAGGVVVSAALLALALWRFSCFEDYTRMPLYSDTDSITEKRNLDLYPTPHQTLPPLYIETDYKWASDNFDTDKVDMGFSNKSFLPEDAFEDLGGSSSRDRKFSFSPRDVYDV